MRPSDSELAMVLGWVKEAQEVLAVRATQQAVATAFKLLSGGMKHAPSTTPQSVAASYTLALQNVSAWCLQKSVKDLLMGEAPSEHFGSQVFFPSAPEMVKYCRFLEESALSDCKFVTKYAEMQEDGGVSQSKAGSPVVALPRSRMKEIIEATARSEGGTEEDIQHRKGELTSFWNRISDVSVEDDEQSVSQIDKKGV